MHIILLNISFLLRICITPLGVYKYRQSQTQPIIENSEIPAGSWLYSEEFGHNHILGCADAAV